MKFVNFLWYTYNSVAPLYRDKVASKVKNCWEMHFLPEWSLKFHKQDKFSNTDQYLSWKLVSQGKFPRILRIFPAIARNPTRGVSWSRVTRFSILDFLIGFPIFFKFSPKMLYLGPNYPKIGGPIDTSYKI
jgi:hypothetical protein